MKKIIKLIVPVVYIFVIICGCSINNDEKTDLINSNTSSIAISAPDLSSFIPIPKEGYDYIVRNSIKEQELSFFNNAPSIQQLISVFGYPSIGRNEIDGDSEQVYYMYYLVDGNKLDVIYNKDLSLKKVLYRDKRFTKFPEASDNLNIEKPIGIVRDDITKDELSFINTDTTPEEVQDILGAPHRDSYNEQLYSMIGDERKKNIRFFMASYFPYDLNDGSILLIHYNKGKDLDEINVASAIIYDKKGKKTILVDRT